MKKNKRILAIIGIVILLFLTIGLGIFKLIDYLSKPKTLFYSSINDTYTDFSSIMNEMSQNKLYVLLNSNELEINVDTKLNISGLIRSNYAKYQNTISSASYISTTKFDKAQKYFSNDLKVSQNGEEKLNIVYVDDNFERYLREGTTLDRFKKLGNDDINIELIDATKNIYIGDIIKSEFLKLLLDDKFESREESIGVNGTTVDCKVSSYDFTGTELDNLITNIIIGIMSNNNTLNYVANIYGIEANNVRFKLTSMKDELKIDSNAKYTFSAYTKKNTDETVRLTLSKDISNTKTPVITYDRGLNYKHLSINIDEDTTELTLKGKLNKDIEIILSNSNEEITLTSKGDENKKNGSINVKDLTTGKNKISGTYNYMLNNVSDNKVSASVTANLKCEEGEETALVEINSSLQINTNIKIDKINVTDYDNSVNTNKKSTKEILDNFLNLISIYLE